jgi:nucleoside-diphosphate-sugar epimerase
MVTKQAIVFGGAGFIGSHLVKGLVEGQQYSKVICVDVSSPRFEVDGVDYVTADVRHEIPTDLFDPVPSDIFNLAAVHVTPGHADWEYFNTNVMGAVQVCRFANAIGCNSIVFTSSISVYGPSEQPLDEDAEPAPTSAYGRSKLAAEGIHKLWQVQEPAERRLTVIRPAVIYGLAERGNFTRLSRLLARRAFIYPGRRDTIKSCGYVKDLVESLIFMSARNTGVLTYNFCYNERYTISEICDAFCEAAGYKTPRITCPIWFMNLAALPFEALQKVGINTGVNRARVQKLWLSTNIIPKRLVKHGFVFKYKLDSSLRDWKHDSVGSDFD